MAKKNKNKKKEEQKQSFEYYDKNKMSESERWREIRRVLRGDYDNWKSFGYSGGTFSGK